MTGILAAIGGIVAILIAFLIAYGRGKRAGEDAVSSKVNVETAETAARMAEAAAQAPRDQASLVETLNKAGF